jgi:alanine dehydrogenase
MSEIGGIENMIKWNDGFRYGVYVYNGHVTNEYLAKTYKLPYRDIGLVMAAMSKKS